MQASKIRQTALVRSSSLLMDSASDVRHRGVLNATGHVQSPCSTEYLIALAMEIMKTTAYDVVTVVADADEEAHIERLKFLTHELQRLIQYPELFISANVEARFFALLGADSRLRFGTACGELLLEVEMRRLMRSSRKNEIRKSFVDGTRNWENFLLHSAPGTQYNVVQTAPKSSFQVIPAVGMRIVGDFEKEESEIIRFVQQSRIPLDVQPAKTTFLVNFDVPTPPEGVVPDIKLQQQGLTQSIRPNPFAEDVRTRLSLATLSAMPVEQISTFINRLEQPPPPPQVPLQILNAPNVFPIFTLRSWLPPTTVQDLRFLR